MPELLLDLPWAETHQDRDLRVRRADESVLRFDDGIDLAVEILQPDQFESAEELTEAADAAKGPGSVVLVAGAIPVPWRARLRSAGVSFIDVSGVAEIAWPRLDLSTGRFAHEQARRRAALPLQKGHAVVVQRLLIADLSSETPTISQLADSAGVSASTASRAVTQLARHGLVRKHRRGSSVQIGVVDAVAAARLLAERTGWPHGPTLSGYLWGRSVFDVAQSVASAADSCGLHLAVTGRVGLAFLGIFGTTSPESVRCWVRADNGGINGLDDIARSLRLEPASPEECNIKLTADPWGIGTLDRARARHEQWSTWVSHPLRVWADLHSEPRGSEFAAQLWPEIARHG